MMQINRIKIGGGALCIKIFSMTRAYGSVIEFETAQEIQGFKISCDILSFTACKNSTKLSSEVARKQFFCNIPIYITTYSIDASLTRFNHMKR